MVNKKGQIKNVEIIRGVDPLLDAEAVRVIKSMPNWEPAIKDGKLVKTLFRLPIKFSLRWSFVASQYTVYRQAGKSGLYF